MFYLSTASRRNLNGVHPGLKVIIESALAYSIVDFGIPKDGGVRTDKQQNKLYLQGATNADGYILKSKHQLKKGCLGGAYGEAFDIFAIDPETKQASWDKPLLYIAGSAIMATANMLRLEGKTAIRLRWGADFDSDNWEGWDLGHFEIVSDE